MDSCQAQGTNGPVISTPTAPIEIRPCSGYAELDACVDLQGEVWGYDERDIIPRRLFVVAQRIGGQVFGAFTSPSSQASSHMIGFAMALPAWASHRPGQNPLYLHSHMLAVSYGARNTGVGRRLKLAQREEALSRGITRMEWTFDPLESKNAFLNIHRLGVIIRSYSPDFYGPSSSALQAGLQTDRMHAEWLLDSDRVVGTIAGQPPAAPRIVQTVELPASLGNWKKSDQERGRAVEVQARNRELFMEAFRRGRVIVGFHTDAEGNGIYDLAESDAFSV